jgi:sugar O-acyltransferase (sialic acid O-acetyltransferase NeuD family)
MLRAFPEWEFAGFYDDKVPAGKMVDGGKCLGEIDKLLLDTTERFVVIAIGDPRTKLSVVKRLKGNSYLNFPTLVHPSAIVMDHERTTLGSGSIVSAGCCLTTGITLEPFVLLNLNVTVGHDARIGEGSSLMPGVNVAGDVSIGKGVLVGSGVNIINHVSIGDFARIGAGAVVIRNVKEHATAVGVPAKEIQNP